MLDEFSFVSDVVKPLLGMAAIVVATGVLVVLLDMAFPDMHYRPDPPVQVVRSNGYTCVKVQGERASTCIKDSK